MSWSKPDFESAIDSFIVLIVVVSVTFLTIILIVLHPFELFVLGGVVLFLFGVAFLIAGLKT